MKRFERSEVRFEGDRDSGSQGASGREQGKLAREGESCRIDVCKWSALTMLDNREARNKTNE